MRILIRADASLASGSGHIMRCLTLADALRNRGATVFFVSKTLPGNFCDYVVSRGYEVFSLPETVGENGMEGLSEKMQSEAAPLEDALAVEAIITTKPVFDWLIVDHYGLDIRWETYLKDKVRNLMVIDDLASRPHNCDVLLDQNFYGEAIGYYDKLTPPACLKLLGPRFILLRSEFVDSFPISQGDKNGVKCILVFFGASDVSNETLKTLQAIDVLGRSDIQVDVVLGANFCFRQTIVAYASTRPQIRCHDYVERMSELMRSADLYVGAAGTTTWERCRVGLPGVVIAVAQNQIRPCQYLEKAGIIKFLGEAATISVEDLNTVLRELIDAPEMLKEMRIKSMKLVDGQGTDRCASALFNYGVVAK